MRKQGHMDEQAEEGSQIMNRKEWQMDTARRAAYGGQQSKQKQPCYGSLIINSLTANMLHVGR
jgi:hypothetical protein